MLERNVPHSEEGKVATGLRRSVRMMMMMMLGLVRYLHTHCRWHRSIFGHVCVLFRRKITMELK